MSGNHSALASLTATYTDSEEEDEIEAEGEQTEVSLSPQVNSNSYDGNSGSSTSDSRNRNPLGLVSYQDDLIEDDDDYMPYSLDDSKSNGPADLLVEDITMTDESQQSNNTTAPDDGSSSGDQPRRVKIPPEPPGKCSAELQERIAKLYDRKLHGGLNINKYIQSNKNFRNPSIYEKLIKHCNIDELGTNYPRDVYDPHFWGESSYYDELAKVQKAEMDKREKEKKERTKIEFQSGTVKKTLSLPTSSVPQSESENKRKSKWDQRGVMPTLLTMPLPAIRPIIVHPPFTTNATGTKTTVINAFGNLPKKFK